MFAKISTWQRSIGRFFSRKKAAVARSASADRERWLLVARVLCYLLAPSSVAPTI